MSALKTSQSIKKVTISMRQMINASVSLQYLCTKAPGPDGIPNIVLKEFVFELAPLIADMYNTCLLYTSPSPRD